MMNEFEGLLQVVTIYHKENNSYKRFTKKGSLRNTASRVRNENGIDTTDNGTLRIFDVDGFEKDWKCSVGDIVVAMYIEDDVTAPLTELRKKYGKSSVYEVSSVQKFIFDDDRVKELNHVKLGLR